MQPVEAPAQTNWSPLSAAAEPAESEVMAQLLNTYPLASESDHQPSFGFPFIFWSDHDVESSYSYSSDNGVGSILDYWPQGCSASLTSNSIGGGFLPPPDMGSYHLGGANVAGGMSGPSVPMDFCCVMGEQNNNDSSLLVPMEDLLEEPAARINEDASSENAGASYANASEPVFLPNRKPPPKRKLQVPESDKKDVHVKGKDSTTNSKKKPRSTADVLSNGKSAQSKNVSKAAVGDGDADQDGSAGLNGQASSSYSSEDDSTASQEMNCGAPSSGSKNPAAPNSKGKTRAGRGAATDPQSLYARKRRERINERLRILQNLVPNGTKVDISTMLEEAVQYVKFLQLQIKLLSSDDLWMYAPIAYNGMNIGLDLKISPPQ